MTNLMSLLVPLAWLAVPVGLICIVDDWLLRPRRAPGMPDAPLMRVLYMALPLLIGAGVLKLLVAERLDFSAVLLAITVVTGLVWAFDAAVLLPRRLAAARAAGRDPATTAEPGTVDYARSFFPVALVVLVLRAFVFEPFRIPSDSMMPTLLDGDFIIVNKYAYGLRLPVLNRKILATGSRSGATWWCSATRWTPAPISSSAWWGCRAIMSRCATTVSSSTASRCRSGSTASTTTAAT